MKMKSTLLLMLFVLMCMNEFSQTLINAQAIAGGSNQDKTNGEATFTLTNQSGKILLTKQSITKPK